MNEKIIAKHIMVEGKVQGVFFRKNTKHKAGELHITGWVRNTEDDKVEIFAQGNTENLSKFINWCKVGPPKASVTNVLITDKETEASVKEFFIAYAD